MTELPRRGLVGALRRLEFEDHLALAAVCLLPWAFGGVEMWAYRTAAFLLVLALATTVLRGATRAARPASGWAYLAPALLLAGWAMFQSVPLPTSLIGALSPETAAIHREVFPGPGVEPEGYLERRALSELPEADGLPLPERDAGLPVLQVDGPWSGPRPLSLLPSATIEALCWYLALLAAFVVVRARTIDPARADAYRSALMLMFLALAVFGLVHGATTNGKIYWIRETPGVSRPFGPFVNPTNFAALMELAVPWMVGWGISDFRRRDSLRLWPVLLATACVCGLAVLAAASRGAAVLVLVGLAAILTLAMRRPLARLAVVGSAVVVAGTGLVAMQGTVLGQRLRQLADVTGGIEDVDRLVTWKAALPMWNDFLWFGCGFGAFRDVYPRYMPAGSFNRTAHLHNDWYQLLIEGGAVAGLLVLLMLVAWAWRSVAGALGGGHERLEASGLLIGLACLAVHAGFDFNHQIPALALMFVTAAAMAVARGERVAT